jgi:hypothetical protein
MRRVRQPCRFQLNPAAPAGLEDALTARRYRIEAPVWVQTAPIETIRARMEPQRHVVRARVEGALDQVWIDIEVTRGRYADIAATFVAILARRAPCSTPEPPGQLIGERPSPSCKSRPTTKRHWSSTHLPGSRLDTAITTERAMRCDAETRAAQSSLAPRGYSSAKASRAVAMGRNMRCGQPSAATVTKSYFA